MKNQQKVLKNWTDFMNFKGSYSERMNILKNSILNLGSPNSLRQLVWVALVDPEYAGECLKFYRKCPLEFELPSKIEQRITQALSKPFPEILSGLYSPNPIKKLLRMFAYKQPNISFVFGMHYIAAILINIFIVETDAFIMLCHILENLYPPEFFHRKNRYLGLHQEIRVFELMAEKMRPKLQKALKAVYFNSGSKEFDMFPFITLMKNIADVWFKTIFATTLPMKSVLQIIDYFLIFGIDFLHKFGLSYLSKKEKFIINSIKSETKILNLGFSVDALIISGNITKSKLLRASEAFDVFPLIKKCIKKETYKSLKRLDYLSNAAELESKASERIERLKKCKKLLNETPLSVSNALEILSSLHSDPVMRHDFNNITLKVASWNPFLSNSIFTLFDQKGEEQIDKLGISIGIILLVESNIDNKLRLCFQVFDTDKSGYLSAVELTDMIIHIEYTLDGRSSFYQQESESMMKVLDSNNDSKISIEEFMKTVKSHKLFHPIIDFMQLLHDSNADTGLDMHKEYADIHSGISANENLSDDASDNLVEQNILEAEIEYVVPEFSDSRKPDTLDLDDKAEDFKEKSENEEIYSPNIEGIFSPIKSADIYSTNRDRIASEASNKLHSNRSEVTGLGLDSLDKEKSIGVDHFIDFPEVQTSYKERKCHRLCGETTCYIF